MSFDRVDALRLTLTCLLFGAVINLTAAADPAPLVHDGESPPARAWRAAMESGDLTALARMHDPKTVGFPPDQTQVVGAGAILKDYAALFAKYTIHVKVDDAHWIEQGSVVVSWGLTTLNLHPKAGGADVITHTRFTDAATRIDGGWLYLVDHASMAAKGDAISP